MVTDVGRHEVQRLAERGAQIVDVLERAEYEDSHLPGAVHIFLPKIAEEAPRRLDPTRPTVTYCYDSLCDMSPRAAARLETLGFAEVYDYVASKVDWIGAGLPFEGHRANQPLLGTLADATVPTCAMDESASVVGQRIGEWPLCVVVDDRLVVLGLVTAEALRAADGAIVEVMHEAPLTFRPHVTAAEIAHRLEWVRQPWLLITNLDGTLVGVADVARVRAAADRASDSAA